MYMNHFVQYLFDQTLHNGENYISVKTLKENKIKLSVEWQIGKLARQGNMDSSFYVQTTSTLHFIIKLVMQMHYLNWILNC